MRTASSETPDSLITALLRALEPASASDPPDNDSASVPKTVTQTLSVERLAAIAAMLATAPSIVAVVPPGVTKGRIAALLSPDERRYAGTVMEVLDRAGVLVEPRAEALRWREPRLFCRDDRDWIVAQVRSSSMEDQ
ncbi:MAG: hypothetical protein J7455_11625 [Roseiflexus sp.]|jgi:hypothetical protein|nr:hypothetical protein [Roseiflexus sp.]MBO9365047.1 hypothetical protein [Roseiflexus sp.]MBO9382220.1 hypothetical protein [Roseiflexus sp.]MBO9389755.1 hypothetical protein [Roseiflexus sp.]